MLVTVNSELRISVETKLEFSEKIDYLKRVFIDSIENISTDINNIENKYHLEYGHDLVDLSTEDIEYHNSEIIKLEKAASQFPQIIIKATIVSIHSIFESLLIRICKSIENEFQSKIKQKQLRTVGNEIDNTFNYLKLVHHLEFEKVKSDKDRLRNYIKIRNCIVHQNGDLNQLNESNQREISKMLNEFKNLEIDDEGLIVFDKDFVFEYLDFILKFAFKFFDEFHIDVKG